MKAQVVSHSMRVKAISGNIKMDCVKKLGKNINRRQDMNATAAEK
jgi:hypothetical protein